jgi:hypothetical protein
MTVVLIYVRYKLVVAKPVTQEMGVANFCFDEEPPQILMSQTVHLFLAELSASQAKIRES